MDICHVFDYERDASRGIKEYVYNNYDEVITYNLANNKNYVVTCNGDVHFFIGADRYEKWCKGRTYLLDGQIMRSGYPVKK